MSIAWGEKIDLPSGGNVWVGGIRHLLIPPHPQPPPFHLIAPPELNSRAKKNVGTGGENLR
jgi:hypothetical protein